MAEKKRGAGGKLSRTETVTVRLDPKLKFGAEMAARKQRRTLSSFIEWAVEEALSQVTVKSRECEAWSAADLMNEVWDTDEPDRFVNLAQRFPDLLTHEEQIMWKIIREEPWYWHTEGASLELIRLDWESIKAMAHGDDTVELAAARSTESWAARHMAEEAGLTDLHPDSDKLKPE